ncbi:hypothetical protein DV113_002534 [Geotrichum candidum]|uniref:Similar to Saccharomyces cerevisiae YBR222C PCS60 Peroxisomal protein that binds AMP and mRNA n=1 Tax=Geotrichum candidum TaxID=1173061 RepID=A0A0J9XB19_GEOCN|nr:hypothetical protein DV452_004304 [Geotrichum candidum]KAF7499407.1 hypothetical protein DV113_002534 [Geotrichum candidum]KAI9214194.1 hypothetical protein DS838_000946 [Geotrichum bryndzae]CDO54029.1 similar to Saccharomyces cerevisiae YBR222C PCS60 Peroxisomal protein that binds AMP and mRNA [Geotrichum candidum]
MSEIPFTRVEGNQVIHSSPWPADEHSYYCGNVAKFMIESELLNANPECPIFIDALDTRNRVLAKEIPVLTRKLATVLGRRYGITFDDTVCIFAQNSIYVPLVMYGILATGGVVSPANISYLPHELAHQLDVSRASIIVTTKELLPNARAALTANTQSPLHVNTIVVIDDLIEEARAEKVETAPVDLPGDRAKTKHALYCFSSGTSGLPKGVVSTHYNLTSNTHQQLSVADKYNKDNRFGCFLPMSHIYGFSAFVITIPRQGATTVLFPKFDFEIVLKGIAEHRINILHIVPPIAVLLAKSPLVDNYPDVKKHLELLLSGAAPLSQSLATAVETRMDCQVVQGYGLTETSPTTHAYSYDENNYDISGIGWLCPNMEARLVDNDGNDVRRLDTPGELYLRGPNVFPGYLRNPEATSSSFEGNWFKTGDVAQVDKNGGWKIVDRVKELIKSRGFQVAPAELEGLLLTHPDVADAAVTAVSAEDEGTEYPRAFIVLKTGAADPIKVLNWINSKVARHKKLYGGLVVVSEVPKSPSGKILRRLLKTIEFDRVYGYPNESARL